MTEVIVMTAYGTIESAVEAMRLGAFDYIQKPFTEQELLVKVEQGAREPPPRRRGRAPRERVQGALQVREHRRPLAGRPRGARPHRHASRRPTRPCSSPARAAPARSSSRRPSTPTASAPIARSCPSTAPRSARRCSRASSSVTRAARSPARSRARKGLFEEADGGTFFFDEIAETPLTFQAKLLRAIQENEIRRVGENKPIQRRRAHHRRDQPGSPDRGRREALPPGSLLPAQRRALHAAAAARAARGHPDPRRVLPREVQPQDGRRARASATAWSRRSTQYDFPGNIRELENMVEQAVALVQDGVITVDDVLPADVPPTRPARRRAARSPTSSTAPSARRSRRRCATATAAASGRPSCSASRRRRSGER